MKCTPRSAKCRSRAAGSSNHPFQEEPVSSCSDTGSIFLPPKTSPFSFSQTLFLEKKSPQAELPKRSLLTRQTPLCCTTLDGRGINVNRVTRRTFLKSGAAAAAHSPSVNAGYWPIPGLSRRTSAYSVRKLLPNDYAGTLKQLAAIGYREVEAAGFFGHSAEDVKAAMASAGLHCVSAHYPMGELVKDVDGILKYAKTLGLSLCDLLVAGSGRSIEAVEVSRWGRQIFHRGMTADDWRWNAEQFNMFGKKFKAEGIQFGYHNHTPEFRDVGGGVTGMEVILKDTDPAYVTWEMDCGWVSAAGGNPIALLAKYTGRVSMVHVKDLKPAVPGKCRANGFQPFLVKARSITSRFSPRPGKPESSTTLWSRKSLTATSCRN